MENYFKDHWSTPQQTFLSDKLKKELYPFCQLPDSWMAEIAHALVANGLAVELQTLRFSKSVALREFSPRELNEKPKYCFSFPWMENFTIGIPENGQYNIRFQVNSAHTTAHRETTLLFEKLVEKQILQKELLITQVPLFGFVETEKEIFGRSVTDEHFFLASELYGSSDNISLVDLNTQIITDYTKIPTYNENLNNQSHHCGLVFEELIAACKEKEL